MEMQSEQDLAVLQKLSNDYEPEVTGPLVGKRQSSQAITTEYAHADPVYVRKTSALPQKYSHYRTVRGDGNCGWRAIAFGYYETLLRLGDKERILLEETRLRSLNNLLNSVGYPSHVYEDFVDESLILLRDVADQVPATDQGASLLEKFNDENVSNAIITHFKLLTAAWMKTHVNDYQPFILDGTVEQYCASSVEPYQVEIEHIGMNALIDALVKPAGFAVEILYLDRSEGIEVNSHRFDPLDAGRTSAILDAPTMRLLYRPGHYDILYKIEDVQPFVQGALAASQPAPHHETRVQLVNGYSSFQGVGTIAVGSPEEMGIWDALPGGSFAPLSTPAFHGNAASTSGITSNFIHSPISPIQQNMVSPSIPSSPPLREAGSMFRPSFYELEADFQPSPAQNLPFQTNTFRNSHFNPAHYRNSEFQPEMWTPDSEFSSRDSKDLSGHARHRSSQ